MTASAANKRLKVLFFSQRFPLPMDTGGKIRTGKILEQLKNIFDITLVSNVESPKDDKYLDQVKNLCAAFHPVPWKEARKYTFKFYLKLLRSLFSRYPFTVINDYSRHLEIALRHLIVSSRFDVLVCDFLQPTLNVRRLEGIPMLLFEHNIETVIPRRHFETARNPIAKIFWWLQWQKMQRYEKEACRKFAGTVTVSERDKKSLEGFGIENIFAIPTAVDSEYFMPRRDKVKRNSLIFTGSMDWLPNEDGIIFFVREILERIKQRIPDVTLSIVGRNPSRYLLQELKGYPEVSVVGWVEDVRPYISRHSVYVIPLRIGGGTRIKAYEAMAMGKAIVSTAIGVEGLPVRDRDHLLVADKPDAFAAAVVQLLKDRQQRTQIERNARCFVEMHCSWVKVAEVFADVCRRVVDPAAAEAEMPSLGETTIQTLPNSIYDT